VNKLPDPHQVLLLEKNLQELRNSNILIEKNQTPNNAKQSHKSIFSGEIDSQSEHSDN
jgi:hypothetical protein